MKNIDKVNVLKSTIIKTPIGLLTKLVAEYGISEKGSISFNEKTLVAVYIDDKKENSKLVYVVVDREGTIESYKEDDGILPTLFLSPNQENYVSVIPYHPDKELEISIPIFNRENTELPKGNRPFVGDFIGTTEYFSIFYDADIWTDTKPDKMLAIEFKNGQLKKKNNIKIPFPRDNKIFISDNEIHLLAIEEEHWIHRQIDEKGNEIKRRKIQPNHKYFSQIISLSFETESYILIEDEEGQIILEEIAVNGTSKSIEFNAMIGSYYNSWQPVKIAEDTFVTKFNGEFGNGWFTTKKDQLLELFYGKGEKGYRNILTNEFLEMDSDQIIISSVNKTTENNYAVIFYPMTERNIKNKEIFILNREIK
ncbi:hypothetical protein [uncultured Cytophaga sp.]|uniref:hypothetical protein n=1 Tax=uncultured Cytophaga sp. TaxID=160238 RepID=UPI0026294057|nr:hypothetical protein [uncultured Cytophaga sp.]